MEDMKQNETVIVPEEDALDRNVRLMSPTQMVVRRFFRSKLSILGLVMIVSLFLFCWVGPLVYTQWSPYDKDYSTKISYDPPATITYEVGGQTYTFVQVVQTEKDLNSLAAPSAKHPLGTDKVGRDVLARLMKGGQISLTVSFLAVFMIMIIGVIFGGIAGYFGGGVDNAIMRICDILMCLPGFPVLMIVGTLIDAMGIPLKDKIYWLMGNNALYF